MGASIRTACKVMGVAPSHRRIPRHYVDSSHSSTLECAVGGIRFARLLPSRGGVVQSPEPHPRMIEGVCYVRSIESQIWCDGGGSNVFVAELRGGRATSDQSD